MSVINQMLRDLDTRQSRSTGAGFIESMHLRSDAGNHAVQYKEKYFWGILLFCSVLLCLVLWQSNSIDYKLPVTRHVQAVKALTDPAFKQAVNRETDVVARVSGADWQFSRSGSVSLLLYLTEMPDKSVTQTMLDSGETEFVLPSVKMDASLPMLKVTESPIESYRVSQRDSNLVLTIKPSDNVTFTTALQQTGLANQNRWVLTAVPRTKEPVSVTKPVEKIRAPARISKSSEGVKIKQPVGSVKTVHASYQRALAYLQASRVSAAVDELQKVLAQNPSSNDARELLVSLYQQSGRAGEANILLKEGIATDPSYLAFTRLYADGLIAAGELEQADRVLNDSSAYAQHDGDYIALQAAVAQRLSRHSRAVNFYMQALEIQPKNSAWWMGLAISLETLDKKDAAAGAYAAAIDSGQLNSKLLAYVNSRLRNLEQHK